MSLTTVKGTNYISYCTISRQLLSDACAQMRTLVYHYASATTNKGGNRGGFTVKLMMLKL